MRPSAPRAPPLLYSASRANASDAASARPPSASPTASPLPERQERPQHRSWSAVASAPSAPADDDSAKMADDAPKDPVSNAWARPIAAPSQSAASDAPHPQPQPHRVRPAFVLSTNQTLGGSWAEEVSPSPSPAPSPAPNSVNLPASFRGGDARPEPRHEVSSYRPEPRHEAGAGYRAPRGANLPTLIEQAVPPPGERKGPKVWKHPTAEELRASQPEQQQQRGRTRYDHDDDHYQNRFQQQQQQQQHGHHHHQQQQHHEHHEQQQHVQHEEHIQQHHAQQHHHAQQQQHEMVARRAPVAVVSDSERRPRPPTSASLWTPPAAQSDASREAHRTDGQRGAAQRVARRPFAPVNDPVQRVQFSDGLVIIKLPSVSSAARTTIEVDRSSTSLLAAPRTPEPTDNSHVADAVVRLPAGAPSGHSQVTVRLAGGPHSKSFSVGTTAAPSRDSSTSTNDARPSAVVRLPKSAAAGEWARERRAEEAAERAAAEAERAAAEAERAKEEAQRVKEEEQRAKAEAQSKAAAQWAKSSALYSPSFGTIDPTSVGPPTSVQLPALPVLPVSLPPPQQQQAYYVPQAPAPAPVAGAVPSPQRVWSARNTAPDDAWGAAAVRQSASAMGDEYGGAMQAHHVPRQGVMQRGHHAQQHQALDVDPTLYPMYAADPAFYPYVMQQDQYGYAGYSIPMWGGYPTGVQQSAVYQQPYYQQHQAYQQHGSHRQNYRSHNQSHY